MYSPGDLQVYTPCPTRDEDGLCNCETVSHHALYDARGDDYLLPAYGVVFLPHSCDEWVIGGPAQIRALIADLESVLMA